LLDLYLFHFLIVVSDSIFLVSASLYSLLAHRNTIYCCRLILYLVMLLNLIVLEGFFFFSPDALGFFKQSCHLQIGTVFFFFLSDLSAI
jgi:hypothetical protein